MNNKAQKSLTLGFIFVIVFFFYMLILFATIEPFKEQLDNNRNGTSLNCPGTQGFDAVDYANDTEFQRRVRRPTCFVTGISMVWFVGAFLIGSAIWVIRNWGKIGR